MLQVPGGVEWNPGQTARLVVAIAARSDSHITILRRLTRLMQDEDRLGQLFATAAPAGLIEVLTRDGAAANVETPAAIGIGVSPGIAIGTVHLLVHAAEAIPDDPGPLAGGADALHEALVVTRQGMLALIDDTTRRLGAGEAAIFKAQSELLNDTDLITLACQIMVEGHGVAWSWNQTVERLAARLSALGNPVLAARAADLRDVGRRVLSRLHPALESASLSNIPDQPCIIAANDLSPSDTAGLDTGRVVALATAQGGPTSHIAILARTLGLPAIVAAGPTLLDIAAGAPAIVDGQTGRLYLSPSADDLASAEAWIAERARTRAALGAPQVPLGIMIEVPAAETAAQVRAMDPAS